MIPLVAVFSCAAVGLWWLAWAVPLVPALVFGLFALGCTGVVALLVAAMVALREGW